MNEGLMSFLPFIIIFILFYFMLIRPQMEQAKDHRSKISALGKGDEVAMSSGIIGKNISLSDQFATNGVAKAVEIKKQKQTIQTILPKGTIKSI